MSRPDPRRARWSCAQQKSSYEFFNPLMILSNFHPNASAAPSCSTVSSHYVVVSIDIKTMLSLFKIYFDVAFVCHQAGSEDGNLWLFNLKNGEYRHTNGRKRS